MSTSSVNIFLSFIGFILFCFHKNVWGDKKERTVVSAGCVLGKLKEAVNSSGA